MTIPFVKTFLPKLRSHPLWLGLAVAGGLMIWAGIIGYTYVIAPAPTEDQIAQQTVRVNETGLTKVTTAREEYRQTYELPALSQNPFVRNP